VDILKIDQSFVAELGPSTGRNTVAAATFQIADTLGIGVVAEGVETPEQAAALADMGVGLVQGFLYSVPLPGDEAVGVDRCMPADDAPAAHLAGGRAAAVVDD
jgi:EAL domain-containing protein (putative c-di-GMP-specific phosphodiesterase class I)